MGKTRYNGLLLAMVRRELEKSGEAGGYAGLSPATRRGAFEKRAIMRQWERWSAANPLLSMGAYFVPGVGTGLSLLDSAAAFSRGNVLGGIGNLALAPLGLIPGGGKVGAALRFLGRKGMRLARRLGARGAVASVRGAMRGPVAKGIRSGYGRLAARSAPLRSWWVQGPAVGAVIGGGVLDARAAARAAENDALVADAMGPYRSARHAAPRGAAVNFDSAGFMDPRSPPTSFRGLRDANPYIDADALPFHGMPRKRL